MSGGLLGESYVWQLRLAVMLAVVGFPAAHSHTLVVECEGRWSAWVWRVVLTLLYLQVCGIGSQFFCRCVNNEGYTGTALPGQ